MKKNIATYLLLLSTFFVFGQEKGVITINWIEKRVMSNGSYKVDIPQFSSECFNFDSQKKSISFNLKIKLPNLVSDNSLQISNLVYESISQSELGDLAINEIPGLQNFSIKSNNARNNYFGIIVISPIIRDGSSFKKLKSFT